MKMRTRYIFAILSLLVFATAIFYKYQEKNFLDEIATVYNESLEEDLKINVENAKADEKLSNAFISLYVNGDYENDEYYEKANEVQGLSKVGINGGEHYINTIKKNRDKFLRLKDKSKLFFGANGRYSKSVIDGQIEYYENEIKNSESFLVFDKLILNILNVMEDRQTISDFEQLVDFSSDEDVTYYFSDLAVLEKYTYDSFRFEAQDEINKMYPYGFEALSRNKEYMQSYYEVMKDYVAGNYDSATYKYSRLEDASLNLNIDFDRLFTEGDSENERVTKKILEIKFNKIQEIKDFESREVSFPILGKVNKYNEDLELCQLYKYKHGLFYSITDNYSSAETFDGFLNDLSQISPKSDVLDNSFNKEVVVYDNNEDEMKYICKDPISDTEYDFSFTKY